LPICHGVGRGVYKRSPQDSLANLGKRWLNR